MSEGLATQQRATAGLGGETVIVAKPGRVAEALQMRDRLIQIRSLLNTHLPEGWRENGSRAQTIERVVDVFLEDTPRDLPTTERREKSQEIVAEELDITVGTVEGKFRGICGRTENNPVKATRKDILTRYWKRLRRNGEMTGKTKLRTCWMKKDRTILS